MTGPVRPPEPRRIRNVLYAFALAAHKDELERAALGSGMGGGFGPPPDDSGHAPPPRRMPQA